jgi:hypothetical protein
MSMNIGAYGELAFAAEATKHGLTISFPFDDNLPFDLLAYNGTRIHRIQVKTTLHYDQSKDRYKVRSMKRINERRMPYDEGDADFLCVFVGDKSWCVIPFDLIIGRGSVNLYPHRKSAGRFEMYRDAWNLLLEEKE